MSSHPDTAPPSETPAQEAARIALGLMLAAAGTSHLTFARRSFQAQVPPWVPIDPDTVVLQSGVVEIALGSALLLVPRRRALLGRLAAAFFVGIFPGNVAQFLDRRDAFGLDTDRKRLARLFFQPLLVAWALWAAGAWPAPNRNDDPPQSLPDPQNRH
jgi:uncharacterized membrane protein